MVQAILAGRKTQTRREVKIPPAHFHLENGQWTGESGRVYTCPYGQVGDLLWVREEHYRFGHWEKDNSKKRKTGRQAWKFVPDSNEVLYFDNAPTDYRKGRHAKDPYTPTWHKRLARFMPKAQCRIFLEIKNNRVERLQDITQKDAIREGIELGEKIKTVVGVMVQTYRNYLSGEFKWMRPALSFRTLWQSINGQKSWDSNPFIWVIEFKSIQKPMDFTFSQN